jgi:hypothetical protein
LTAPTPSGTRAAETAAKDRPNAAALAQESAKRILDLTGGKDAPVVLRGEGVRKQLERIADGPQPGKPFEVPGSKGSIAIGDSQAKALGVLRELADATAARRAESHDPKDQLEIVSFVRGGEGKHGDATAFDIAAYGGHRFDERRPEESRKAAEALLKDLPAGDYGLGLPRLPNKHPIPENPAHFKQYLDDVAKHPEYYERVPGGAEFHPTRTWGDSKTPTYAVANARPSDGLLRAEDPHFRQPDNAAQVRQFGDLSQLDRATRTAIDAQRDRGVHVTPFPDGFGHAHLSVVQPGAKTF